MSDTRRNLSKKRGNDSTETYMLQTCKSDKHAHRDHQSYRCKCEWCFNGRIHQQHKADESFKSQKEEL